MKVLTIADLHWDLSRDETALLQSANEICDCCFCLGDIPLYSLETIKDILEIPIVGVLGNHDEIGMLEKAGIPDLDGVCISVSDLLVAGLGGSNLYKTKGDYPLYTQKEKLVVEHQLETMPCADVLLCHCGPYNRQSDLPHRGFKAISRYIRNVRPGYVFYGHNHNIETYEKRFLTKKNGRYKTVISCCYRVGIQEVNL